MYLNLVCVVSAYYTQYHYKLYVRNLECKFLVIGPFSEYYIIFFLFSQRHGQETLG